MATPAPHDIAVKNRHPTIIVTDAFLNSPIRFNNDARFDPESLLKDAGQTDIVRRDQADFVVIDLGISASQKYVVAMYTPSYNRDTFLRVFNQSFTELK